MITEAMIVFDRMQMTNNCGGKGGTPGPCPTRGNVPVAKRVEISRSGKRVVKLSEEEITKLAEKKGFKLSKDKIMRRLQLKEFARSGGKRITPRKGFDPEGWRNIPTRNQWQEISNAN